MTTKQFTEFINSEFKRLGINDWMAIETERTRFSAMQYESGACNLRTYIEPTDDTMKHEYLKQYIMTFYTLKTLSDEVKKGRKLTLILNRRNLFDISKSTVEPI